MPRIMAYLIHARTSAPCRQRVAYGSATATSMIAAAEAASHRWARPIRFSGNVTPHAAAARVSASSIVTTTGIGGGPGVASRGTSAAIAPSPSVARALAATREVSRHAPRPRD